METNYQTYEYLTTGNVENCYNPVEQYAIVDPTVVTDKNHMQYVEQVQSHLEVTENVTGPVYEANSQPFYFDLNVPPELSPMTVNSVQTAASNVYGPPSNPQVEMVLTAKQCEMFKQRGWILLDINNKVLLLDSTGLHDVTDDHKLVNKLRNENQMMSMIDEQPRCEMDDIILPDELKGFNTNICADQAAYIQTEQMGIDYGNEVAQDANSFQQLYETPEQERCEPRTTQDSSIQVEIEPTQTQVQVQNDNSDSNDDRNMVKNDQQWKMFRDPVSEYHLKGNKLSKRLTAIDSEYRLKEIPSEVVLGKTVNGKNLVARVVKGKGFYKRVRKSRKEQRLAAQQESIVNEHQLAKLVEQVLLGTIEQIRQEDIAAAEAVVSQLIQVHEFRTSLHDHKLIVTKTIREKNEYGLIENVCGPTLVTGRLVKTESGNERRFVYISDLLQQHIILRHPENPEKPELENPEEDLFLHININEVKGIDNISQVSVTVNKRYLSLSAVPTTEKNAVFMCNTCSRKFNTMKNLKRHQENQCSELPEISFYETQPYTILKNNNTVEYICNECKEKFVKRKDCQAHIQTHHYSSDEEDAKYWESFSDDKEQPLEHKCKLCPCSFSVASYLTEHIYKKHLTGKTDDRQ